MSKAQKTFYSILGVIGFLCIITLFWNASRNGVWAHDFFVMKSGGDNIVLFENCSGDCLSIDTEKQTITEKASNVTLSYTISGTIRCHIEFINYKGEPLWSGDYSQYSQNLVGSSSNDIITFSRRGYNAESLCAMVLQDTVSKLAVAPQDVIIAPVLIVIGFCLMFFRKHVHKLDTFFMRFYWKNTEKLEPTGSYITFAAIGGFLLYAFGILLTFLFIFQ